MGIDLVTRTARALGERVVPVRVLLARTTDFLGRTSLFAQYEGRLRELNTRLSGSRGDDSTADEVRRELIEIRKGLRQAGYDLSLGNLDLALQGFRGDAAQGEGFRRAVLFLGDRTLWCLAGEANHLELHDRLERLIHSTRSAPIRGKHYVWFRWDRDLLVISGAATETASDWEAFKVWCEGKERRLSLLSRMRRIPG